MDDDDDDAVNGDCCRVRERDESSYAICLSHECRVKHYRIDILPSGNFAIQDGPKFDSLIAVSSLYFFCCTYIHITHVFYFKCMFSTTTTIRVQLVFVNYR